MPNQDNEHPTTPIPDIFSAIKFRFKGESLSFPDLIQRPDFDMKDGRKAKNETDADDRKEIIRRLEQGEEVSMVDLIYESTFDPANFERFRARMRSGSI